MRAAIFIFLLALSPTLTAEVSHIVVSVAGGQSHKTWHGQADVQALNVEIGKAF